MPANAIVSAVQGALAGSFGQELLVELGIPTAVNDPAVIYVWHDGYADQARATEQIRRTHNIAIQLLVLANADPAQAEAVFLDYSDRIADVFYRSALARRLNNTVASLTLTEQGPIQGERMAYLEYQGGLYRYRQWIAAVAEDLTYDWSS